MQINILDFKIEFNVLKMEFIEFGTHMKVAYIINRPFRKNIIL